MPTQEKKQVIDALTEELKNSDAVIVSHYRGMSVEQNNALRKKLREAGIRHKVYKNTLAKIAAKAAGKEEISEFLTGPTVVTLGSGDIVAPAKILVDFAKECDAFKVLGGVIEGKKASAEDVKAIASLPSREELLAKLLGSLNSPISGLVRVLNGPLQGLHTVLTAISEKKSA